jgi:hypothetical protein
VRAEALAPDQLDGPDKIVASSAFAVPAWRSASDVVGHITPGAEAVFRSDASNDDDSRAVALPPHPLSSAGVKLLLERLENNSVGAPEYSHAVIGAVASMAQHSCDPTCHYAVLRDGRLVLVARRDIAAGGEVSISYVDVWQPAAERREELRKRYAFTCTCRWCDGSSPERTRCFQCYKCQAPMAMPAMDARGAGDHHGPTTARIDKWRCFRCGVEQPGHANERFTALERHKPFSLKVTAPERIDIEGLRSSSFAASHHTLCRASIAQARAAMRASDWATALRLLASNLQGVVFVHGDVALPSDPKPLTKPVAVRDDEPYPADAPLGPVRKPPLNIPPDGCSSQLVDALVQLGQVKWAMEKAPRPSGVDAAVTVDAKHTVDGVAIPSTVPSSVYFAAALNVAACLVTAGRADVERAAEELRVEMLADTAALPVEIDSDFTRLNVAMVPRGGGIASARAHLRPLLIDGGDSYLAIGTPEEVEQAVETAAAAVMPASAVECNPFALDAAAYAAVPLDGPQDSVRRVVLHVRSVAAVLHAAEANANL